MSDQEQERSGFWATVLKPVAVLTALAVVCVPFRNKLAGFIEKNRSNIVGQTTSMFTGIESEAGKINSIAESLGSAACSGTGWGLASYAIDRIFSKREDKPTVGKHTESLQKQQTESTIERQ